MKTFTTNQSMNSLVKRMIFIILFLFISIPLLAQDKSDFENAKNEIEQTFGTFPSFFKAFPNHALSTAWEHFKTLKGPNSPISSKNAELIQLAVSSQIPCVYCVYFHRMSAKGLGASEEEIKQAVALGAETRHWSMVLQGSGISFEDFKMEFDNMMKYMAAKAKE